MSWIKHAFAVDPPGPAEPDDVQREVVDRLCREVVRKGMTTPALAFLEMSRPLNNVGSMTLHYFKPIVSAIFDTKHYDAFARFLEHRGSIEYICRRIEAVEEERDQRRRAAKAKPKPKHKTDEPPTLE